MNKLESGSIGRFSEREMREKSRKDLKRLRMSLDGVREYYRVQRRLIEQRAVGIGIGS